MESLEPRAMLAMDLQIDYSLDTSGFFAASDRRALVEQAASLHEARLNDSLAAIAPGGTNTWTLIVRHPGTGNSQSITNPSIPANTIRVYVGGRSLGGSLGVGGPAGFSASGTQDWLNTIQGRGEPGALGSEASRTDFAPAGGSIAFNTTANWHFGSTTSGLDSGESDFLSTAIHEIGHVLGFGASPSWRNRIDASNRFAGSRSVQVFGQTVPLNAEKDHWADGTSLGGQETAMDPTITNGKRKLFTELDFAGLDDMGWEISAPPPAVGSVTSVSIINANTNQATGDLSDGQTINLANYPISLRANTSGSIGSVRFTDNGNVVRTENFAPYSIAGDSGTDFTAWNVSPGSHTLVVTPFTGSNGTGSAGAARTISFTVTSGTATPSTVRVNAGGAQYTTAAGQTFAADTGFSGGAVLNASYAVAGTVDDPLYYSRRYGKTFTYARAVTNGTYQLKLHFAEGFFTAANQRKIDVTAEGNLILNDLDIFAAAGARTAHVRTFNLNITDGTLNLSFVGVVGDALVAAIELVPA